MVTDKEKTVTIHYPVSHKDGSPDTRYEITLEYCGYLDRRFVARFCGEWLGQSAHESDAVCIAANAYTDRTGVVLPHSRVNFPREQENMSQFYRSNQLTNLRNHFARNAGKYDQLRMRVLGAGQKTKYLNISLEELTEIAELVRKRDNGEAID